MSIKLRFQALGDLLQRYSAVWRHAWAQRQAMRGPGYTPQEAEFLPAALALQESPLSPAPRVAMWLLIAFACLALLWTIFGRIDVVATAQGKIVPNDRVKTIQPLEVATVSAIHVRDGQAVRAGDVLVELDGTTTQAELERLTGDWVAASLQAARGRAMLIALASGHTGQLTRPQAASERLWIEAQQLLQSEFDEYRAKFARLESDLVQRDAERQSTQELVHKLEQTAPLARQRAEDYKNLVDKNFVSRHGYLEKEQARIEQEADLATQRSRLKELAAAIQSARAAKVSLQSETRRQQLDSITEGLQKVASLEQELLKARSRNAQTKLLAPVDGTVQQLATHTVGGVVTEAQPLMIIVPKDNSLEIEAFLENKDIGFVREGQDATLKVETFQYTKYGTLQGTVSNVSSDAINDEKRGLIYTARIKMTKTHLMVEGRSVNLSPGMAVTVEIKTGKRRVIEYFLSPLIQHGSESLRER